MQSTLWNHSIRELILGDKHGQDSPSFEERNKRLIQVVKHLIQVNDVLFSCAAEHGYQGNADLQQQLEQSYQKLDILVAADPECFKDIPNICRRFPFKSLKFDFVELASKVSGVQLGRSDDIAKSNMTSIEPDSLCTQMEPTSTIEIQAIEQNLDVLPSGDHVNSDDASTVTCKSEIFTPKIQRDAQFVRQIERVQMARILEIVNASLEGEYEPQQVTKRLSSSSDSSKEDEVVLKLYSPEQDDDEETRVLHITNLVRPFTLTQLSQLLSQTGNYDQDRFWINPIRSHCYVSYETVEMARNTRRALHKKRWPQNSPKVLFVHYAREQEVEQLLRPIIRNCENTPDPPKPRLGFVAGLNQGMENQLRRRFCISGEPKSLLPSPCLLPNPAPNFLPLETLFNKTECKPSLYWKTAVESKVQLQPCSNKPKLERKREQPKCPSPVSKSDVHPQPDISSPKPEAIVEQQQQRKPPIQPGFQWVTIEPEQPGNKRPIERTFDEQEQNEQKRRKFDERSSQSFTERQNEPARQFKRQPEFHKADFPRRSRFNEPKIEPKVEKKPPISPEFKWTSAELTKTGYNQRQVERKPEKHFPEERRRSIDRVVPRRRSYERRSDRGSPSAFVGRHQIRDELRGTSNRREFERYFKRPFSSPPIRQRVRRSSPLDRIQTPPPPPPRYRPHSAEPIKPVNRRSPIQPVFLRTATPPPCLRSVKPKSKEKKPPIQQRFCWTSPS